MAKAAVKTKDDDDDVVAKTDTADPKLASDVAPGFVPLASTVSAWTAAGTNYPAKIFLDTPVQSTETPPRQTPPTSIDNAMKHSPPSFHDSNGAAIVSLLPTLSGISPATAVAVTGADLTTTATGTNFNRATFLTFNGAIASQTAYVSATSLTCLIKPSLNVPGVVLVRAQNPAGASASQNFTFT